MELERPLIGFDAPNVDLFTVDGQRWRLGDHRGKPVVLIFHRHIH